MLHRSTLAIMTRRMTFTPPPVLPAQAPISMRQRRIALEKAGQRSKFTVEKPVVVMMLLT